MAAHRKSKARQLAGRIEQTDRAFTTIDREFAFRDIKKELLMQSTRNISAKLLLLKARVVLFFLASTCLAQSPTLSSPTNIFAPASTPARSIFCLSLFLLAITALIFVLVVPLLTYVVVKFRNRNNDNRR